MIRRTTRSQRKLGDGGKYVTLGTKTENIEADKTDTTSDKRFDAAKGRYSTHMIQVPPVVRFVDLVLPIKDHPIIGSSSLLKEQREKNPSFDVVCLPGGHTNWQLAPVRKQRTMSADLICRTCLARQ